MKIIKKKSLGQNFLRDERVLDKIISAGELSSEDNVLEIGPGEGALTKKLLAKAGRVIAVEKDSRLKDTDSALQKLNEINKRQASAGQESGVLPDNLTIYFEDILDINLPKVLKENNFDKNGYKVIANIPYYITGKIIRLLFEQEIKPKLIVLLVQKEVAERICALKGRESILSLSVKYFAQSEIVDYVSREVFEPVPKVDSAILKIRPFKLSEKSYLEDENLERDFFRLVKIGFSSPRKVLINNLKNGLQLDRSSLEQIFKKLQLNPTIRAEKLTLQQWLKLTEEIF